MTCVDFIASISLIPIRSLLIGLRQLMDQSAHELDTGRKLGDLYELVGLMRLID